MSNKDESPEVLLAQMQNIQRLLRELAEDSKKNQEELRKHHLAMDKQRLDKTYRNS